MTCEGSNTDSSRDRFASTGQEDIRLDELFACLCHKAAVMVVSCV
jgi:hypothetical protein